MPTKRVDKFKLYRSVFNGKMNIYKRMQIKECGKYVKLTIELASYSLYVTL